MAGGHLGGTQPGGQKNQLVETEAAIAARAGVRRPPGHVFPDEVVHDHRGERLRVVNRQVGQAQAMADLASATDCLGRTTAGRFNIFAGWIAPEAHRDADNIAAGVSFEQAGGGAVDATAHGDEHAIFMDLFRLREGAAPDGVLQGCMQGLDGEERGFSDRFAATFRVTTQCRLYRRGRQASRFLPAPAGYYFGDQAAGGDGRARTRCLKTGFGQIAGIKVDEKFYDNATAGIAGPATSISAGKLSGVSGVMEMIEEQ